MRETTMLCVDRMGELVRLRLNRTARRNALTHALLKDLTKVVDELHRDPEVRVVAVTGEGPHFSSGADLDEGRASRQESHEVRRRRALDWQHLLASFESLPQATVAGIHGHCMGGAALLAVSCDLRVADRSARISLPEVRLGIPLAWGGIPRLARELGLPMARDLVMTGREIDATEAQRCGFVQRVCPEGELPDAVKEAVEQLLAVPAEPLRLTKAMTAALTRSRADGAATWADADLLASAIGRAGAV